MFKLRFLPVVIIAIVLLIPSAQASGPADPNPVGNASAATTGSGSFITWLLSFLPFSGPADPNPVGN